MSIQNLKSFKPSLTFLKRKKSEIMIFHLHKDSNQQHVIARGKGSQGNEENERNFSQPYLITTDFYFHI